MNHNNIISFLHCRKCVAEKPAEYTMEVWARTQTGLNSDGEFEVWCNRHDIRVAVLTDELKEQLLVTPCEECGKVHAGTSH